MGYVPYMQYYMGVCSWLTGHHVDFELALW